MDAEWDFTLTLTLTSINEARVALLPSNLEKRCESLVPQFLTRSFDVPPARNTPGASRKGEYTKFAAQR